MDVEEDKSKKYDPNKVDKKYIHPHGLTAPLKNCRKRRFRKTLKKRYIDAPENEKEVRHLVRQDLDAVRFTYELMTEEEAKGAKSEAKGKAKDVKPAVDETDIFGGEVSDSDDEQTEQNIKFDSEGESFSQSKPSEGQGASSGPTQFSSEMFPPKQDKVAAKMEKVKAEIAELRKQKSELENNIANCDNLALQQRFRASLSQLEQELRMREDEQDAFSMFN